MTRDDQMFVLTWVGTVAGVLGLIAGVIAIAHPEGFPVSPFAAGCTALGLVALALIVALIRREILRPDIECQDVTSRLEILDANGDEARTIRTQKDRVNRRIQSRSFSVGGITATTKSPDDLYDFQIDGSIVPDKEYSVYGWRVSHTWLEPYQPGQVVTTTLTFKTRGAYTNPIKEDFGHAVSQKEKRIRIEVTAIKKPKNAVCVIRSAGIGKAKLPVNNSGHDLWIDIANPEPGSTYSIEWEW